MNSVHSPLSGLTQFCEISESIMIRTTLVSLAVVAGFSTAAEARTCDAEPQFAAHRTANSSVRAQYNAVTRERWRQAIAFGVNVANSGTTDSHKGAAMTNLCAAYAATGDMENAMASCNAAVDLRPDSWRAYNNRGAAYLIAGDYTAAAADFARAGELGGDDEVAANATLSQCGING